MITTWVMEITQLKDSQVFQEVDSRAVGFQGKASQDFQEAGSLEVDSLAKDRGFQGKDQDSLVEGFREADSQGKVASKYQLPRRQTTHHPIRVVEVEHSSLQ